MTEDEIHDAALLDVLATMNDESSVGWVSNPSSSSSVSRLSTRESGPLPVSQPSTLDHQPFSRHSSYRNRIAKIFLVVGLSVSGLLFWKHFSAPSEPALPPADQASTSDTYIKPIQTVQLVEKSIGTNPLEWQVDDAPQPDPQTWREIHFEMTKANGLRLWMEFLWPLDQIETSGAGVGEMIDFELEEMGAVGPARCTYIGPCPPIQPGPGNVVTGRFKHEAGDAAMVNVLVQGAKEPITSTDNHLYWSEDRQDFVEAGELQPGENIWSDFQGVLPIVSVTPAPKVDFLHNLQIHGQHVYEVSELGVLVHNSYNPNQYANRVIGRAGGRKQVPFTGAATGQKRIADGVRGATAYEAKFVKGTWRNSAYNPKNIGRFRAADRAAAHVSSQMDDYAASFSKVVFYSNSKALLRHVRSLAKQKGFTNVITRHVP